jgi:hypothetical protein
MMIIMIIIIIIIMIIIIIIIMIIIIIIIIICVNSIVCLRTCSRTRAVSDNLLAGMPKKFGSICSGSIGLVYSP